MPENGVRAALGHSRIAIGIYVRAAPSHALLRLLLSLVGGAAPVAVAVLSGELIDELVRGHGPVVAVAVAISAVTGLAAMAVHLSAYAEREITRRVLVATQDALFGAVDRHTGIAVLEDPAFHDRLRLAQQASQMGPQTLTSGLVTMLQAGVTVIGFMVTLLRVSPLATVLVFASVVPTLGAQLRNARRRADTAAATSPRLRRQLFFAVLLTDLRAAKETRLFGLGPRFRRQMLDELRAAQRQERATDRASGFTDAALSLLTALVSGVALVAVVVRVARGEGPVGDVAVLVGALAGVQGGLTGIVGQIAAAAQVLALFPHYRAIVRGPADTPTDVGEVAPLGAVIRCKGLWFRYTPDGPWVLRGVSLDIRAGTSTAIVGLNGAGKSTLIKLLCRLYEPTRGSITWDGVDLRELDPVALRRRISSVFQDFMAYDMTAADNIAVGDVYRAPDRPAVIAAARAAGVDADLAALPAGYDTMLSRLFTADGAAPGSRMGGALLSGGQWQRVAIARALLRTDVDLLILDEPTSGLDAEAEALIHAGLRDHGSSAARLLISHRLNTVRDADRIVVLRAGRIVETGTHAQLMAAGAGYARLFQLQAAGYADADEPSMTVADAG